VRITFQPEEDTWVDQQEDGETNTHVAEQVRKWLCNLLLLLLMMMVIVVMTTTTTMNRRKLMV
jgi:hypothetical protein